MDNVERVELGFVGDVSLDIITLTQYSGQGKCGMVMCFDVTADRYREEVRGWAQCINWEVNYDEENYIIIKRPCRKGFSRKSRKNFIVLDHFFSVEAFIKILKMIV